MENKKKVDIRDDIFTVNDIMAHMGCSRHMVMKYYSEYNLPLRKEKNKYVIDRTDFYMWLEEMQRLKEEQERQQQIIAAISIIIALITLLYVIFKVM